MDIDFIQHNISRSIKCTFAVHSNHTLCPYPSLVIDIANHICHLNMLVIESAQLESRLFLLFGAGGNIADAPDYLTHKAPPIICSRQQFEMLLFFFSKITNKA